MRSHSDGLSKDRYAKWHSLMMLLVLAYGLFSFFVGEKVPAGGGFGWDGVIYADIAKNLPSLISNGAMSNYYAQRLLPSLLVRTALQILGLDFSNINIVRGFVACNVVALLGANAAWKAISDELGLELRARWLGFGAIFVNFFATKQAEFYPVLTDMTALFIGMLLLLCSIKKRPVALLLTAIAGSFVWQVMGLCGALLMVFMKTRIADSDPSESDTRLAPGFRFQLLVAWLALLVVCIATYFAMQQFLTLETFGGEYRRNLDSFITGLPSLVAAGAAILAVIGSVRQVREIFRSLIQVNFSLWCLAFLCLAIPKLIVVVIANQKLVDPNGFAQVLAWVVFPISGGGRFLAPFIGLSVFWGPAFLLMVLLWRKVANELRHLGPGVMAIVCLHIVLGLVSEPRYTIGGWPFAVTALALALDKMNPTRSLMCAFGVLSVLASQFWLKIVYCPWPGGQYEHFLEFPKQLFFMHYGAWMSWTTFLAQAPFVFLSAFWLWSTVRNHSTDDSARASC